MPKFLFWLLAGVCLQSAAQPFVHLNPGGLPQLDEAVPVTYVFVGFPAGSINESAFRTGLPASYSPVVRSRLWYGVTERLGLRYSYTHHVVIAGSAYENQLFGALASMAQPAPRTLFQDQYNAQARNVLNVGQNHIIDAPSVEKWLIDNPPPGVDTRRNTVFFLNWWGRADFKFHVYTKFGEPDPDTGYDFGVLRNSRKIAAWGGTTPDDEETGLGGRGERRVWFHDLSAGPESWSGNWNVDNADLDGDGQADYRIPMAWEYFTPGGYRAASALTGDLAKLARYVAINLLFTTSPLYPPYLTPESLPATINADLNTFEGWNRVNASDRYQTLPLITQELTELMRTPVTADKQQLPFSQADLNCHQLWLNDNRCYPNRPYPASANLFLQNALNLGRTRDGGGDYEGAVFNYATADNRDSGILGFADDNWIDGTQSFVFNFITPSIVALGYGLSTTAIHEFGHHLGMSHPHDGYDSETGVDYGPSGGFFYAWAGDESNSIMSYIDLNWDFSQFDRDNMNRFQAAAHLINANRIARDIVNSSGAALAAVDLNLADQETGLAKSALSAHDYPGAFDHARLAYRHVLAGAGRAGVPVTASANGWAVLPALRGRAPNKPVYSHIDRFGPGSKRSAQ